MPNRILRDWTDSEKINELSVHAERFFTRLIMRVDDFGCFTANLKMLKSNLFPLLIDEVREADITRWMAECQKAGIVVLYEVDNKQYLQISEFKQRLRLSKSKYPLPNDGQTTDKGRLETKRSRNEVEIETEVEGEMEISPPPSNSEIDLIGIMPVLDCAKTYFSHSNYQQAVELLIMNPVVNVKSVNELKRLAMKFNEHCELEGKGKRTVSEWGKHFRYWAIDPKRITAEQSNNEQSITETPAQKRQRLLRQQQALNAGNDRA